MNLEINKIYNMDCIKYMKTLPNECVDLIIADPPYGQNIRNEKGKIGFDCMWTNEQEFLVWCKKWINESYRILKK